MIGALRRRRRRRSLPPGLGELKLRALDHALERFEISSMADLGAVWAVEAGYTRYALHRGGIERAVVCDEAVTPAVRELVAADPRLSLVEGDFAEEAVAERVGGVDAVLMFDVLLHQVRPDWDEVLARYAPRAEVLILAGPWWAGAETVRLLEELGSERYLELVPNREFHAPILDRLDEHDRSRGRAWRDVHDIWQWGIADADLRAVLDRLGFALAFHENRGAWGGHRSFLDCSYVFCRPKLLR